MQSDNPVVNTSAAPVRPPLHPLVKVAAVSVIAASAVGIWAMTARTHSNVEAADAANTGVSVSATNAAGVMTPPAVEPAPATVANAPEQSIPAKTTHHAVQAKAGTAVVPPYQPPAAPAAEAPMQVAAATPPAPAIDPTHGHIESVYATEKKGEAKGVGAVAGGAVGGLVGNSFGRGNGRTAVTLLGVVGGALAGNEIEKHARTVKVWHVVVRLDDGSSRTLTQDGAPVWRQGDEVRFIDGRLTRPDGSVPAPAASAS